MCNPKQSLAAKLDWSTVFEAFGFGSPSRSCLPQSFVCPLCPHGTLSAMDDHVLGAQWFACRECTFSGDLIELVAAKLGISIHDAIAVIDSHEMFQESPTDEDIRAFQQQHIQYRERINRFWQTARERPLDKITRPGINILKKLSLAEHVLNMRWTECEGQLFGMAEASKIEELFAPLSFEEQIRPNRNGRSSKRRGGGPGPSRLFVGHSWDEVIVIPHFDLPGRIIGFTFIGRDADQEAGDIIYKRANLGRSNQRPKETGVAMLPSVRGKLDKTFETTVFVFTNIVEATLLHARRFRECAIPLPVVAINETPSGKSLHLPMNLEDRRLVFCGPLQMTLPLARRHNGLVSEYEIPLSDFERKLNRRDPKVFLRQFQEQARPWLSTLEPTLNVISPEEGRLLLDRLDLTPTEYRQILADSKQQERIATLAPLRLGAKKVIVGNQVIIEKSDGWFVEGSGERICNYPLRIDVIRTTDLGDTQYEIAVQRRENPINLRVNDREIHEGNLFAAVNRKLLELEGEPLVYQHRKWSRESLFIAQELSEPETVRDAGRIGWSNDGHRFQFPNFSIFHNGDIDRDPMPVENDKGPSPAFDLSPPRKDPVSVDQLSDESTENQIVWAIAACVIQHLTTEKCHREQPVGIVLDGEYAHETGVTAAIAVGCGVSDLAARRNLSYKDYICSQCSFHDFPVLLRMNPYCRMRMQASWLDEPNFRRAVMSLNSLAAISVASRSGFVRISHGGHPQPLGSTAVAARWIIPSYLQDLLRRRHNFEPAQHDQLVLIILDDMAEWFEKQGGNPNVVINASRLLQFDSQDVERAFLETVVRLRDEGVIACVRAGAEDTVPSRTPVAVVAHEATAEREGLIRVYPALINVGLRSKRAPAIALDQIRGGLDDRGILRASQGDGQDEQWLLDQGWWDQTVASIRDRVSDLAIA